MQKGAEEIITIEQAEIMLEELTNELPPDFFSELNGGVCLLPDIKLHPGADADDLYILGEYHRDNMGRCIYIYFGSMAKLYGHSAPSRFKRHLKKTLLHEFTHHWESLAGERGLEIKDEQDMERYKRKR